MATNGERAGPNPRLREFISDHFSSYQAFQALRRVSGTMAQAREQWTELRRLKISGSARDQVRMENALDESIVEIAYSIEHNLAMLHSLISTQYGNVDDLTSKLRQNRYYARQVDTFLRDVESIDAFVDSCAAASSGWTSSMLWSSIPFRSTNIFMTSTCSPRATS